MRPSDCPADGAKAALADIVVGVSMRPFRIALPLVVLSLVAAAACSGPAVVDPAPKGDSLIVKGDQLCEQLFKANDTYLTGTSPTVDGLLAVGGRVMPAFKALSPPGDVRWTSAIAARWKAVQAAKGFGEELTSPLWEFIGAARVAGLWTCGSRQTAALAAAPRPSGKDIEPSDYGARIQEIIDSTAVAHEAYHEQPDPAELQKRVQPGVADSHGPGYLAIEDRIINGVAKVPPPKGQHAQAAAFLSFLRQARAAEAKGISIGGIAGDAVYELGFFWTAQAIGVACVVWALDLCD